MMDSTQSHWRQVADSVILRVAHENPGLGEKELRAKMSEAYPFGLRRYHPYKMWLAAVSSYFKPGKQKTKKLEVAEGQLSLL